MEFCSHGTRVECIKAQKLLADEIVIPDSPTDDKNDSEASSDSKCNKLHFKKIIQAHTDVVLGDCSFLNTCFHMSTCKYVHYQVDNEQSLNKPSKSEEVPIASIPKRNNLEPSGLSLMSPQWIQCDLRYLDMSCLGKFSVIMADPPW